MNVGHLIPARQRARLNHEKEARRQAILGAAARGFEMRGFQPLTMAALAAEAGLAKGTIYIYFKTKEEIFLELAGNRLLEWFEDVDEALRGAGAGLFPEPLAPAAFATLAAERLEARAPLPRLLALLHTLLAPPVGRLEALRFRELLADRCLRTGRLLELRLPCLREGEGADLVLRILAIVPGLLLVSDASPEGLRPPPEPGLEILGVPFRVRFEETVRTLLAGLEARGTGEPEVGRPFNPPGGL